MLTELIFDSQRAKGSMVLTFQSEFNLSEVMIINAFRKKQAQTNDHDLECINKLETFYSF